MFLDTRMGEPQWHLSCPKDYFMRVPHQFLDCVVFVGRIVPKGSVSEPVVTGTAFLLSVPCTLRHGFHTYLVTARHVAEPLTWGEWFIRINTNNGVRDVRVNSGRWWKHPTEPDAVDAAVMAVSLDGWNHVAILASTVLATDARIEECYIGPGDEVFTMGLFHKVRGQEKILPVVRTGNLAMMPTEKVTIGIQGKLHESEVYLTESRSIDGLSGSPVFVRNTVAMESQVKRGAVVGKVDVFVTGWTYLLGLMHGQWNIREQDYNQLSFPTIPGANRESIAVGFAVVVPAKKINDILMQDGLVRERLEIEQTMNAAEGTTATD